MYNVRGKLIIYQQHSVSIVTTTLENMPTEPEIVIRFVKWNDEADKVIIINITAGTITRGDTTYTLSPVVLERTVKDLERKGKASFKLKDGSGILKRRSFEILYMYRIL